jgi:hypothetical protein
MEMYETTAPGSDTETRRQGSAVAFFLLTFALSWAVWVPMALLKIDHPLYKLGTFGPTVAGLLLTGVIQGRRGLRALWRRLLIWRVSVFWYLFSFLLGGKERRWWGVMLDVFGYFV